MLQTGYYTTSTYRVLQFTSHHLHEPILHKPSRLLDITLLSLY